MSTTATAHRTVTCEYSECDVTGQLWEFTDGRFCSSLCHDRDRREKAAQDVLGTIDSDHRLCSTCYRWIKEVEQPPERWGMNDAVTGYQYPTPDAVGVWKDRRGRQSTGIGCTCGNCTHSHRDPDLQPRNLMMATHRLLGAIGDLQAEGTLNVTLDREQLFRAAIDTGAIRPALEVAIEP